MKSTFVFAAGILFTLFLSGCLPDNSCDVKPNLNVDEAQLQADIDAIESYLSENNIDAEVDPSGIRYVIHNPGDGKSPSLCKTVAVTYEGRLMSNGNVFDGTDSSVAFGLNRLITGWQVGIPLLEEGGSITLYIPSVYGYGSRGSGNAIPPNANLIFDIELKTVL
ncbi:FKBP-type peptidyl-prolyl cis-trans isomerase [Gracilimonas mengyeensis]|uniref:Peptidyl-prolyl cis-trans isomerase n=1 Tax=Gracilimonas mengyeensis TaxID=1302730 RepID=A0A521FER3_9BACT|nr:FKBP-type peptidyl-prolyl cis-trans isomerase [Gracilimonas mengyeensis]SMO94708.1 FKBP-type peptidyl-prolyl cis-trans isomerase FkpA [Gracilimonas mengyeensis]